MKTYNVVFETRQLGAIGSFYHSSVTVTMYQSSFSDADVFREAGKQLNAEGLETRFPISKVEILPENAREIYDNVCSKLLKV